MKFPGYVFETRELEDGRSAWCAVHVLQDTVRTSSGGRHIKFNIRPDGPTIGLPGWWP